MFAGGQDFDGSTQRIVIPAGQTRVNFTVPITVDNIFEDPENFIMRVDPTPGATALRVSVGTQETTTGEIIDDGKFIVMRYSYKI